MESSKSVPKCGPTRKTTQCRRSWTVEEERVLLHALKEIVVQGFKCDNGFKSGYQNIPEQSMKQAFLETTLWASPHISSKIHVWKKDYGSISSMLSRTGFGWNDSSNTLIVKEDIFWDEYVKTDPNAKTMRYKSWPYYKDWCEIFGKDRATGENAQGFAEVVQDMLSGEQVNRGTTQINESPQTPSPNDENDHTSTYNPQNSARASDKSQKKIKQKNPAEDRFLNVLENLCDKTNAHLAGLAKCIGFEQDASSYRKSLFDALDQMTFLSVESKIVVATQLSKKIEELDIFFSLSNENKAVMVKMVLEGKI